MMMQIEEMSVLKLRYYKEYLYKSQMVERLSKITAMDMEKINRTKTEMALEGLQLSEFGKIVSSLDYDVFDMEIFQNTYGMKRETCDDEEWEKLQHLTNKALWIIDIMINNQCRGEGYGTFIVNVFKRMGYPIVVYSTNSADSYWERNGFVMTLPNVYVWEGINK